MQARGGARRTLIGQMHDIVALHHHCGSAPSRKSRSLTSNSFNPHNHATREMKELGELQQPHNGMPLMDILDTPVPRLTHERDFWSRIA
jgi:hypothetical protein